MVQLPQYWMSDPLLYGPVEGTEAIIIQFLEIQLKDVTTRSILIVCVVIERTLESSHIICFNNIVKTV